MHKYMPLLLERIERGKIDPSFIITHRVTLDAAPAMTARFARNRTRASGSSRNRDCITDLRRTLPGNHS